MDKVIKLDEKEIVAEKKILTDVQKGVIEKKLGARLAKTEWTFYIAKSDGKTGGKVDGYALIDNELGKEEPITFLTALTPQGSVKEVEILAYREAYGGEVRGAKYLKQYRGKKSDDPVRVGQDIVNISGATISSRSVALGVKRALSLWSCMYGAR